MPSYTYGHARWGSKVLTSATSTLLVENQSVANVSVADDGFSLLASSRTNQIACDAMRFLRPPPFPGAGHGQFAPGPALAFNSELVALEIRRRRVGGTYWGKQPLLPSGSLVVRSVGALEFLGSARTSAPLILWTKGELGDDVGSTDTVISGDCDPWHVLGQADAVVIEADDEWRVIAALLGLRCYVYDPQDRQVQLQRDNPTRLVEQLFTGPSLRNPFTGDAMAVLDAVKLCGFWRDLIDSNRDIAGGVGFAFWKQDHVAPLLWAGADDFRFLRSASKIPAGKSVAIWRAKAPAKVIDELENSGTPLVEVEDGFIRSRGLGANCIPPLSLTVDRRGAYFDPSGPSDLEQLLEHAEIDSELLTRARELRCQIVDAGLGKYETGGAPLAHRSSDRRLVLVAGQVEDDRAVELGGCGLTSNVELLKKVRREAPDAHILYKPHPDVVAGHRNGAVSDNLSLEFADEVVDGVAISSLIEIVDEVHVNTSLAGFEALLRNKRVVTYGVPFYAGWGLTHDLGPIPNRRTTKRNIDELVACCLLLYPRYLDPETGLPCPAEILASRLSAPARDELSLLVIFRRLQGRMMRKLRGLVQ